MGGNEHGHTQLNCYAAVLIYVYLCSLRTVTLAVGILFRLGRVVGEWRVHGGGLVVAWATPNLPRLGHVCRWVRRDPGGRLRSTWSKLMEAPGRHGNGARPALNGANASHWLEFKPMGCRVFPVHVELGMAASVWSCCFPSSPGASVFLRLCP